MAAVPEALYLPDGERRFVPTELTRGPWSPRAQHGGAPASLLAGLIDAHESAAMRPSTMRPSTMRPSTMRTARLTVELLRPVPLSPLDVRIEMLRPGRKVQLVQASLFAEDTEVVRATGLRIRTEPLAIADPDPEPVPDAGRRGDFTLEPEVVMFAMAFDIRRQRDWHAEGVGPQVVWFRLRVPVIAGTDLAPIQRVAAAADFPNGISSVVPWSDGWVFINPDLTIHLARPPRGEWIGLDARTVPGDDGIGIAEAALFDERGRVGRAAQSLLFERSG